MNVNALPLSPIDYVFTGIGSQPITFAFYYPYKLDSNKLRKTLTEILHVFPILQSRLVKIAANEYGYQLSDDGLTFGVVESNLSFKKIKNIKQVINPVNSIESNPLTKIALTQTQEGSVLAVSISHALVDGYSYFHFLSSWARLYRGDRFIHPSLERNKIPLTVTNRDSHEKTVTAKEIYHGCGIFYEGKRNHFKNGSVREERIFLSKDTITSQLEKAKFEYTDIPYSENDIITALLWKKYTPMWNKGNNDQETYITCPVDFRKIVKTVPRNYFGCAICFASTSLDLKTVIETSVGELARLINRSIRRIKCDYVLKSLQTLTMLRKRNGIDAFENLHVRHPRHGLIVTNLTRMPIKDLDFDGGAPKDFLVYSEVFRGAAVLPAENGVEVVVLHPS